MTNSSTYLSKALVFLLLVACNTSYKENRYILDGVSIRLVDAVDISDNGCVIINPYEFSRENNVAGIGIAFTKKFVSDSTEEHQFGVYTKGTKGIYHDISTLNIYLLDHAKNAYNLMDSVDLVEMNHDVMPDETYHRSVYNTSPSTNRNGCTDNPYIPSTDSLKNWLNMNADVVKGEKIQHEIYLWIDKKQFNGLISSSHITSLEIAISDESGERKTAKFDLPIE